MDERLKQLRSLRPDLADALGDTPTEEAVRATLARATAEAAPAMTLADRLDAVRRADMATVPKRQACDLRDNDGALSAAAAALARERGRQAARDWCAAQLAAGRTPWP
jgi:hypothetical protein